MDEERSRGGHLQEPPVGGADGLPVPSTTVLQGNLQICVISDVINENKVTNGKSCDS